MDDSRKYVTRGLLIFTFLIISALVGIYAAQTQFTVLFFACIITIIILSFGLLYSVLQANRNFEKSKEEIVRLRQREKDRLQGWQQTTEDNNSHQEIFNIDEVFARIIPAAGMDFESVNDYTENTLQNIAKELGIAQGLIFVLNDADQLFHISGQYAFNLDEKPCSFTLGETLTGQVAKNRKILNIKELPEGYITILSGLGKSSPRHLLIAPIVYNYKSIGVIELASFKPFGKNDELLILKLCESVALLLNELRSLP